jgi:hypothetical protein
MTATADAPSPIRASALRLIVLAAIESLGALRDIPAIFYDFNPTTPLGKFAQALGTVGIVLVVPSPSLRFISRGKAGSAWRLRRSRSKSW